MSNAHLPPTDDEHVQSDDTLPPEHPASSDAPVSAGEVLSGEGVGTGAAAAPSGSSAGHRQPEQADDDVPGDDS